MRTTPFLAPALAALLGIAPLSGVEVQKAEAEQVLKMCHQDDTVVIDLDAKSQDQAITEDALLWSKIYADQSIEGDLPDDAKNVIVVGDDRQARQQLKKAFERQQVDLYSFEGDKRQLQEGMAKSQREQQSGDRVGVVAAGGSERPADARGQNQDVDVASDENVFGNDSIKTEAGTNDQTGSFGEVDRDGSDNRRDLTRRQHDGAKGAAGASGARGAGGASSDQEEDITGPLSHQTPDQPKVKDERDGM